MNYVYLIQSQTDNSICVGSTRDLLARLKSHASGKTKSTKPKRPYKLLYYEAYLTYTLARKREIAIKKSWSIKEEIINRLTMAPSSSG